MMILPTVTAADYKAVGATEVDFDTSLALGVVYALTSTVDAFVTTHATAPAATVGDGSALVAAGTTIYLKGSATAVKVSIIKCTGASDGHATLTPVKW